MFKFILLFAVIVYVSAANHFETTISPSDIGLGKGWVYLNKIKFKPTIAKIVFEVLIKGKV